MTTLVAEVTVHKTERKTRKQLFDFRGSYGNLRGADSGSAELLYNQNKILVSTKLLCVYFSKPTVIQLTIGSSVSTLTVEGTMIIPGECSVSVTNTSTTATDPLMFSYIVA